MVDGLRQLLFSVPALIALGLLYWFVMSRTPSPDWFHKITTSWKKVNLVALGSGAVMAIGTAMLSGGLHWLPTVGIAMSAGLMTFAGMQAAFTDPQARSVDRRMLYLVMIPPFIINLVIYLMNPNDPAFAVWMILILFTGALLPFPLMGASDARALIIVSVAAFPPIGLVFFSYGFGIFLVSIIVYTLVMAAITSAKANEKKTKTFFKYIVGKHSIPAVPFIILPFALLIPISRILMNFL